jgi:MFS family permease
MSGLRQAQPTAGPQAERVTLSAWWMAILLAGLYALSMIDRNILVHLVEPIKADLELTDVQIGFLIGPLFSLPLALFAVPLGWAADRLPRRPILCGAVLTWTTATTLCAFTSSYIELVGCRVIIAISEAALTPVATSMLADRFPPSRLATAIALYNTGPKIGLSLVYVLAGVAILTATAMAESATGILAGREMWQLVLLMIGFPGIFIAFLVWTVSEPARKRRHIEAGEASSGSFGQFIAGRRATLFPFFLGFCMVGVVGSAIIGWVPAFMGRTYGWNAIRYGPWLGAISIVGASAILLKGLLVDYLYKRGMQDASLRVYMWMLAICIPFGFSAFLSPSPYYFLAMYLVLSTIAIPYVQFAVTAIQLFTPPEFRGRMVGLFMMVVPLCGSTGALLTAAITDHVFADPQALGWSLSIISTIGISGSLACLGIALKKLAAEHSARTAQAVEPAPAY